jgi:hypothetical protein
MSTFAQLKIKDISNCSFLTFIGSPASRKTTMLGWFSNLPTTVLCDEFSPASFVSHYAGKTEEELKTKVDLLPQIKGKVLITPELGPTYTQPREVLVKNLGTITRVLDGQGYTSRSGVHGGRGYKGSEGSYVFHWLGAIAYIPNPVWRLFGNLGPRAYNFIVPEENNETAEGLADESKEDFSAKSQICRNAVTSVVNSLWTTFPEPVDWEKDNDSRETTVTIGRLSMLLAKLRGNIEWFSESEEDEEGDLTETDNFSQPIVERAHRANQVLYNYARGHALFYGRKYVTTEDLPLVTKIAIDSARPDRVALFKFLLLKGGAGNSKEFATFMNVGRKIAIRTMKTLRILELVDMKKDNPGPKGGKPAFRATLKDDYKWFLTQDFGSYRT